MAGGVFIGQAKVRRRDAVALGVVLALHLLVLAAIGLKASKLAFVAAPEPAAPTDVWLVRLSRPATPAERARVRPAATRPATASMAEKPLQPASTVVAQPQQAVAPSPASPSGSASVARPAATGAPSGGLDARVLGALRANLDCDHPQGHQLAEVRERCDRKLIQEARRTPQSVDRIPPNKRAYYDAVQRAYEIARYPTPIGAVYPGGSGAAGALAERSNAIPGRMGGVGCGLRFSGPPQAQRRGESLSDQIKSTGTITAAIGPLACGIVLPRGPLTPEIGIAPP